MTKLVYVCKRRHESLSIASAGLSIIARHAAQFKEYLAKDHEVNPKFNSFAVSNILPHVYVYIHESVAHVRGPEPLV